MGDAMTLFERFAKTKEDGFRNDFVKPLLMRMGFVGITNNHGQREFGKDFVFSELDRFGQLRHMIVQAKHKKSIIQGKIVSELTEQVKQAFRVPFYLPSAPNEERRVSAVYVFNTGKIQDNARADICGAVHRTLQPNVHFFSGDQLDTLWNMAGQRYDEQTRLRLIGLQNQLMLNDIIFDHVLEETIMPPVLDLCVPIVHGFEEYLTLPIAPDHIDPAVVGRNRIACKAIEALAAQLAIVGTNNNMHLLQDACMHAKEAAETLRKSITAALDALPETTID
jgi:hypothetical protein